MESCVRAPGRPREKGRATTRARWAGGLLCIVLLAGRSAAAVEPPSGDPGGVRATPGLQAAEGMGEREFTLQDLVDNPPVADRERGLILDDVISDPTLPGDAVWPFLGNVRWEFQSGPNRLRLLCDRLLLVAPGILKRKGAGGEPGPAPEEPSDSDRRGPGTIPSERRRFYIYADGNIRLEVPRQRTLIEAQLLYYEQRHDGSELCFVSKARLKTTVAGMREVVSSLRMRDVRGTRPLSDARGFGALPLVVAADALWTTDFENFRSEGLRATTCDYEKPHFSLAAPAAEIRAVEEGTDGPRDFTIDFEDGRFELHGRSILPLPISRWDTRWHDYFPIRDIALGQSSKYGVIAGVDWNVNFFLKQLPLEKIEPLERAVGRSRLDFETTYFSKRGFGWGPKGEYGRFPQRWAPWPLQLRRWDYYGEGRYFAIHDEGEDRSSTLVFPDKDRFWGTVKHRQAVPYLGYVDVEYSELSDTNFLREYFESIQKEEKKQESLLSLRRNIRGNTALTGLFKYRTNDFESEVERLPEAKFHIFQEPIFRTGLYGDLTLAGANLRTRPADSLALPSRRFGRFDALNEWSLPISRFEPYLEARPFFTLRYTAYEELADPARGSEDRASLGAGVTVSQQWSRTFDSSGTALDRWFGLRKLKHVVTPKVTYFNLFVNDLPSSATLGLDDVDVVDREESIALSLRQAFISRTEVPGSARKTRPILGGRDLLLDAAEYTTRTLVDSEVSFVVFPRSGRDNGGDPLSLAIFDNTVYPGKFFSLRAWIAADLNDGLRLDTTDISATVDWIPGALATTVGDRFTRRSTDPRGNSNFIYTLASLALGEKWRLQGFWSHDLEQGRNSEISVAVARILHRFAVIFEFSVDPGEDYNQSYSVNFSPLSMLGGLKERMAR